MSDTKGRYAPHLSVPCETAEGSGRSESRLKTATIGVRVTEREKAEIQALAAERGLSASSLLLACYAVVTSVEEMRTHG